MKIVNQDREKRLLLKRDGTRFQFDRPDGAEYLICDDRAIGLHKIWDLNLYKDCFQFHSDFGLTQCYYYDQIKIL